MAYGILGPSLGIKLMPPAVKVPSLNWIPREVLVFVLL